MSTDFSYNGTQIVSSGPFKPSNKNVPVDARTRVNAFADISSIPSPYVGMVITVLADENTDGTMKDYKVKSLKANNLGIADSLIDEVVPYADYLGVSGSGVTEEQAENIAKVPSLETNQGDLATLETNAKTDLVSAINELFQSCSNIKQQLVDALTAAGVDASIDESIDGIIAKIESNLTPNEIKGLVTTLSGDELVTLSGVSIGYK